MADEFLKALGSKIRKLREAKGLSMEALGTAANTTHVTIGSIERGETATNLIILRAIGKVFKQEPWELLRPEEKLSVIPSAKRKLLDIVMGLDEDEAAFMGGTVAGLIQDLKGLFQKQQSPEKPEEG